MLLFLPNNIEGITDDRTKIHVNAYMKTIKSIFWLSHSAIVGDKKTTFILKALTAFSVNNW